ncbi:MAG: diaminopimelate epimerase, partial [Rhodobacterales bacterium]|nr:diaminopimelate epimerase [Rhodobacterales bacterium]
MTNLDIYPNGVPFLKMHGLGNDFVIIDARESESPVNAQIAKVIGDRHFGVGYDQLVVITKSKKADVEVVFWNSDGSLSDACGNASRCVAKLIMDENNIEEITLKTGNGVLVAQKGQNDLISVNMGHPQLDWDVIPLKEKVDLIELPIEGSACAVGIGNPHCVFVVDDVNSVDLISWGSKIETHELFPKKTNVEFIQIIDQK